MNCDVDILWIFCLCILDGACKFVDNSIKASGINNIAYIDVSKSFRKIFDECSFFIAVLNNSILSGIDVFFNNWNDNS